jgi:chloramphenicol-sensitive protein RarD
MSDHCLGVYIYAVNNRQVVESSLGLFLIPLTTALVGVVIFGEKLGRWQWAAGLLAGAATAVIAVDMGRAPWIALVISGLMGCYALLKKQAGVAALPGFTVECLVSVLPAIGYLAWLTATKHDTVWSFGWSHLTLVAGTGLLTAIPLVAHAGSIKLLPLVAVGFIQFLNPSIQLFIGVVVGREHVSVVHWAGLAGIWCALMIFASSSFSRARQAPAATPLAAAGCGQSVNATSPAAGPAGHG